MFREEALGAQLTKKETFRQGLPAKMPKVKIGPIGSRPERSRVG